jgi:dienelactone hydrolase
MNRRPIFRLRRTPVLLASLLSLLASAAGALHAAEPGRVVLQENRQGVLIEDLTFPNSLRSFETAYRVCPAERKAPSPAILFVHWLDTSHPTSNRTQFLDEAITLARRGACSLLVEAMWADPDWFPLRDPARDRVMTERQAKRLQDSLGFLLDTPGLDKARVAYVGHDFGGMFGALLAAEERRVRFWAFQAATARWHEWYLIGRKLEGEAREKAVAATADLDPVAKIAKAEGTFYFQFATSDPYVPRAVAEQLYGAAPGPKSIEWYEAGHVLNAKAGEDRIAWLTKVLGLKGE